MSKQASIFGKNSTLALLLKQKGVETVVDLALLCGESKSDMNEVVNGKSETIFGAEPGVYRKPAQAVADFLQVHPEVIFGEDPRWDEIRREAEQAFLEQNPALAVSPEDVAILRNLKETTTRVLASLTPREQRVLFMRFAIGSESADIIGEVGGAFALSRERIREIEAKALRKLKHPSRSRKLRAFLDQPEDPTKE